MRKIPFLVTVLLTTFLSCCQNSAGSDAAALLGLTTPSGLSGTEAPEQPGATFPPGSPPPESPDNPEGCTACATIAYEEQFGVAPPVSPESPVDRTVTMLNGRIEVFLPGSPFNTRIRARKLNEGPSVFFQHSQNDCLYENEDLDAVDFQSECLQGLNLSVTGVPRQFAEQPLLTLITVSDDEFFDMIVLFPGLENLGRYEGGTQDTIHYRFFKPPTPLNDNIYIESKNGYKIGSVSLHYQMRNGDGSYSHFCAETWPPHTQLSTSFSGKASGCRPHIATLTSADRAKLRGYLDVKMYANADGSGGHIHQAAIFYFPGL